MAKSATSSLARPVPGSTTSRAPFPFPPLGFGLGLALLASALLTPAPSQALPSLGTYEIELTAPMAVPEDIGTLFVDADITGFSCSGWNNVSWIAVIELGSAEMDDVGSLTPVFLDFSESQTMIGLSLPILDDMDLEGDETFDVVLKPNMQGSQTVNCVEPDPGTYEPNAAEYRITIEIEDDEQPGQLVVKSTSVVEGDAGSPNAEVFVSLLDGPADFDVMVDWSAVDGTATAADNDYLPAGGTVMIVEGQTEATILVPVVGDTNPEGDEEFFVDIFNPTNAVIVIDRGTVTIENDDGTAGEFVVADVSVGEDGGSTGSATFAVTLQSLGGGDARGTGEKAGLSVEYATLPGTATPGEDYVHTVGILSFDEPGETRFVDVPILEDDQFEGDETFDLFLRNPMGATIGRERATATIVDDDSQQSAVRIADAELGEGDSGTRDMVFQLTLEPPAPEPVTVSWQTEDGTATAEDEDYAPASGVVTFQPGEGRRTIEISIEGDTRDEDDETFDVLLTEATNAVVADDRATGTIVDDDATLPRLAIADTTVLEGDAGSIEASLEVTLQPASNVPVTVDFATADGSATAGTDYRARTGTLTFEPGATTRRVRVPVRGDTAVEGDEIFTVNLSAPEGAEIADGEGTVTITDDDDGTALPGIAISDVAVVEGNQGTTFATFVVSVAERSKALISVDFETVDGTALAADGDYEPVAGRLQFDSEQRQATIEVPVLGDTRREDDEFFEVVLSLPDGAEITRGRGRGVIRNDDGEVSTSLVRLVDARTTVEGAGPAVIVVERLGAGNTAAQAVVATVDGTARAGADYRATTQVVRWAAGESGRREVAVPVIDDRVQEGEERFAVVLRDAVGARLGRPNRLPVVVLDDDSALGLEAVGEQELEGKVRGEIEVQVRVTDGNGEPVADARIGWQAEGRARVAGEAESRSSSNGIASQTLVLAQQPGPAEVTARLLGTDSSVVFRLRVVGNLMGTIGDGEGGGDGGAADVLDQSCAEATGEFAQLCDYLFGLDDPDDQREAVSRLLPRNALAQGRSALRAPKGQFRNLTSRTAALRGGMARQVLGRQALGQLAMSVQGDSLSLGPLQEALARYVPEDAALGERLASAVAEARPKASAGTAPNHVLDEDPRLDGVLADDRADADLAAGLDADLDPYDATESPWGFFLNGHAAFGDAPRRGQEPGYDFSTQGLTAGVDFRASDQLVVGLALGYLRSDNEVDQDRGSIDIEGTSLSLYLSWFREAFYVDTVISYGTNRYDIERVIALPQPLGGVQRFVAEGSPDSDQLGVHVGVGYDTVVGQALQVGGFVRGSYVEAEVDAYSETGALFFDLAYEAQEVESLLAEVGFEMSYPKSVSFGVVQPLLRVSWLNELEDDLQVVRARLVRDPFARRFALEGETPDTDYFNVALGVSLTLPRSWATFFQYDTDLERDDLDIYTLSGGFRFQF